MIIAVDFDDTLCIASILDYGGKPNIPLFSKLIEAKKKGHKIILWTCRGGDWLEEAIQFCEYYDLEFDAVNENIKDGEYVNISHKIMADLYIDDKAPGSINHFLRMK